VDSRIITAALLKRQTGHVQPVFRRRSPVLAAQNVQQAVVLLAAGANQHIGMVFSRCPDERNAANVNFLDYFRPICAMGLLTFVERLLERVEVNDHQVELRDGVFVQLRRIRLVFPTRQDATEHFWVKRLDPSPENRRVLRQVLYRRDLRAQFLQIRLRSARGIEPDPMLLQAPDNGLQAFFGEDRDEGSFNREGGGWHGAERLRAKWRLTVQNYQNLSGLWVEIFAHELGEKLGIVVVFQGQDFAGDGSKVVCLDNP